MPSIGGLVIFAERRHFQGASADRNADASIRFAGSVTSFEEGNDLIRHCRRCNVDVGWDESEQHVSHASSHPPSIVAGIKELLGDAERRFPLRGIERRVDDGIG